MSAYTDAEVEAVHEFAWHNRDLVAGSGSYRAAMQLLDKIAPAIAARALREAAEAVRANERSCLVQRSCHQADEISLTARADSLERS